jgi:hypothetical protein
LAYHAARILVLIARCGKPRTKTRALLPGIVGRTLLAKLDFFVRYPAYLRRAEQILRKLKTEVPTREEERSVEAGMVRYLYGPWDHFYYPVLAYLIGKQLIAVEFKQGTEVFRVTSRGQAVADELAADDAYSDLTERAEAAYHLFNTYTGNRLKTFIYQHFPEVVNRGLGEPI